MNFWNKLLGLSSDKPQKEKTPKQRWEDRLVKEGYSRTIGVNDKKLGPPSVKQEFGWWENKDYKD